MRRLALLVQALLLAACPPAGGPAEGDGAGDCTDGLDNDGDGTTDCDDDDCADELVCSGDDDDAADDDDDDDATEDTRTLDERLAEVLAAQPVPPTPLVAVQADPAQVALGRALFFDPILSGNGDVACASCHHPDWGTSDGLSLTVGAGATGVGPARAEGNHPPFFARHSIDLFNRGDDAWRALFWDNRVEQTPEGIATPVGVDPVAGLSGVLAAQALFPLIEPGEMLGAPGDTTAWGDPNELAGLESPQAIWAGLMDRLMAIDGYEPLFAAAFPDVAAEDRTFALAANALAAFQAESFSFVDTPWDRYLAGDPTALRDVEKLGAIVFFGAARCGACHSGALLSDQEPHATGVVQLGPGLAPDAPFDHGRERITGDPADRFAFRTSPLRNVALSAPYMHNGALLTLDQAVLHYAAPESAAERYDPTQLHPDLVDTVQQDPAHLAELVGMLSPDLPRADSRLTVGLSNVREFLIALTDPTAEDLSHLRPESVPSGLPVP